MRRQVPLALCLVAGTFMAVQYFIPHHAVQDTYEVILDWLQTLLAFAFLLGTVSLIRMHWHKIRNRADDRGFSFVTLGGLAAMIVLGFVSPVTSRPGSPFRCDVPERAGADRGDDVLAAGVLHRLGGLPRVPRENCSRRRSFSWRPASSCWAEFRSATSSATRSLKPRAGYLRCRTSRRSAVS